MLYLFLTQVNNIRSRLSNETIPTKEFQDTLDDYKNLEDHVSHLFIFLYLVLSRDLLSCAESVYLLLASCLPSPFQIATVIGDLENQVSSYNEYQKVLHRAVDWIRKTRINVQQSSDPHGEKHVIEEKRNKVLEIEKEFPEGLYVRGLKPHLRMYPIYG